MSDLLTFFATLWSIHESALFAISITRVPPHASRALWNALCVLPEGDDVIKLARQIAMIVAGEQASREAVHEVGSFFFKNPGQWDKSFSNESYDCALTAATGVFIAKHSSIHASIERIHKSWPVFIMQPTMLESLISQPNLSLSNPPCLLGYYLFQIRQILLAQDHHLGWSVWNDFWVLVDKCGPRFLHLFRTDSSPLSVVSATGIDNDSVSVILSYDSCRTEEEILKRLKFELI